jgi:epoxyqueuosine reductase
MTEIVILTEDLKKQIIQIAADRGASRVAFADLSSAYEKAPHLFEEPGRLLTGISLAMYKDDSLVDGLPQTDDEYRTDHYHVKIETAQQIGKAIVELLQGHGYEAYCLSHPPRKKANGLQKLVARYAGMGWIGKNHLLITPLRGPRLALGTVFTNAPFVPTGTPMERQCGDCRICIDICPVHALEDVSFDENNPIKGLDTNICSINKGVINPTLWGGCGLCVKACPYGIQKNKT